MIELSTGGLPPFAGSVVPRRAAHAFSEDRLKRRERPKAALLRNRRDALSRFGQQPFRDLDPDCDQFVADGASPRVSHGEFKHARGNAEAFGDVGRSDAQSGFGANHLQRSRHAEMGAGDVLCGHTLFGLEDAVMRSNRRTGPNTGSQHLVENLRRLVTAAGKIRLDARDRRGGAFTDRLLVVDADDRNLLGNADLQRAAG